ncbi:hypothetical protein K470DRAFT_74795 [Piedraia hortae CBS 480.64]|uniref:EF-hand domain-containing protein n=1 Tax=Piedraia hortae CBS 480.64 TaxID=1314780 RepID=A0A6A7BZ69_9PEZI|nr:hypothetical protein K470DRAFT_74795 [Piedraia hortae CBS 480.64]
MSLHAQHLKRHRLSREGFSPIPNQNAFSSNDATIDIPLEQVPGDAGTGGRTAGSLKPQKSTSEKRRTFGRRIKKEAQSGGPRHVGYDGEEDTITAMGRVYSKILNFSTFTRYLVYVVPLALIILIPIIVGATVAPKAEIGGVPIVWFFSWVEVVWGSLWASKVVAHYLPYIFQIFAGVVSSGVRKYAQVIRALEIPISLVGWAVCSLATFIPIMTRNPAQRARNDMKPKEWEFIMQNILAAATICTLVFLAEKTLIQIISIDYHRKQFSFRIKESKRSVHLLGLLYESSRALFPAYCNEFAEEDYIISDQLNLKALGLKAPKGYSRSGSATPGRILQDIGRYGDKITSAFGNVAQEITGREVFNPNSAHSIVIGALEKTRSAEALAKRIWMSFVVEGREALYFDDILDVLGDERRQEAEETFAVLDRDGNGDISLDEMILTVQEFGRERKAIASSLHDVDQAINVLDKLLSTIVFIAVVFIFVAFLNKSFVTTLATTGTALLSLSFVFSVTCQEVLGSCIFVFVKHPYDVGDRIDIKDDQFQVEHISLLFSVFRRISGINTGRTVQIPNIVLNTVWIENISRSKAMSEQLSIDVAYETELDDIQTLKAELTKFVKDKDNSRDFQPDVEVFLLGTTDQAKLVLQVEVKHKSNWANEAIRRARRNKFMCALITAIRAVPIYPPGGGVDDPGTKANPTYRVTISDEEAKKAAKDAEQERKDARLVSKTESSTLFSPVAQAISTGSGFSPIREEAWNLRDDSSTLGRTSIDEQNIENVRGILRRASTKGKRKPADTAQSQSQSHSHWQQPSVSAIQEVRSENVPPPATTERSQGPLSPTKEDEYGNVRPYSGA